MALSRERRQDRAEARHDLLERADHLYLRRIRRAPRRPHGHHRNRRPLVYPAGAFGRRPLRVGEVRTEIQNMMLQGWRWPGPVDRVSLEALRRGGATALVMALHRVPIGEGWPRSAVEERKNIIENIQP